MGPDVAVLLCEVREQRSRVATEQLARLVLAAVRRASARLSRKHGLQEDDLASHAFERVWSAVLVSFDPVGGRCFDSYVRCGVGHAAVDLWRRSHAQRRGGGQRPLAYDETWSDESGVRVRMPSGADNPEATVATLETLGNALAGDPILRFIVERRIAGDTSREIARAIGRSPSQITRRLQALRYRLGPRQEA
jgi:DNA-directed RNA polymerase specialized sigma24 family protein